MVDKTKSEAMPKAPGFKLLKPGRSVTIAGRTFKRSKDVLIKTDKKTDVLKNITKISYVPETLILQHGLKADFFEGEAVADVKAAVKAHADKK